MSYAPYEVPDERALSDALEHGLFVCDGIQYGEGFLVVCSAFGANGSLTDGIQTPAVRQPLKEGVQYIIYYAVCLNMHKVNHLEM